jgi:RNA polymerase sigma-70 factor (sigma-E family)
MTCLDNATMFTDFVQANNSALMRTAYALTGSVSAAEELVQDTLVRLYSRWERVQNADVPLAYVRRALTNQFLNERRRTTNREVVTDTVPDRPGGRSAENDVVDRDQVVALLKTLGRRQRAVLVLRYYDGLSDAEIAETLGSRPGTVRSLISRSLAALRQSAQPASQPARQLAA